ncbi:hypothetical protein BDW42DRAFT_188276 [Aspergillus taichungensis]|uniref:Integrase zinc-binding domain-containing protein n=1 Tax=Aspergillus taichungensis TaxID=482145 RepID=A0A2J5HJJ8_9EURO|nr:hypothetical protein BDW42DRAFT_188276 [Aspergillus taichungensis]
MSSFGRRSNDAHENYVMNHQIALPIPYNHGDNHDFGVNEPGQYQFPQQAFHPFTAQFNSPYGHPGVALHAHHLSSHTSPGHSMSTVDHPVLQHHHHHHQLQYMSQPRYLQSPRYLPLREALGETDIESQDSRNENTMLSEPVIPALEGFPDVREFDQLMKSYVDDLSVKKQDKALIHAKRARNIKTVLTDPKDTAIESAQFRYGYSICMKMICHEGKPVAVREKLFKILTKAHQQCQHGGRDKTSAQVRQFYSWVPKELISRFVKICPTCQVRRGGSRLTPPNSRRSSPRLEIAPRSPKLPSPPISKRESAISHHIQPERTQADCFNHFSGHTGWMDSQRQLQGRQNMGSIRSFVSGAVNHLPEPLTGTVDSFHNDISMAPAQVNYNLGYASTQGAPSQRDF